MLPDGDHELGTGTDRDYVMSTWDPEANGITEAEWRCRERLASAVFDACGVDLMAFNNAARRQSVVVALLARERGNARQRPAHGSGNRSPGWRVAPDCGEHQTRCTLVHLAR